MTSNAEIQRIVETAEEHGDNTIYSLDDIKVLLLEIARLSRPEAQSDQVEFIRSKLALYEEENYAFEAQDMADALNTLLSGLDAAQREMQSLKQSCGDLQSKLAMVGEALAWTIKNRAYVFEGQVYCLEPCATGHEHLRPILLQYAGSKQA